MKLTIIVLSLSMSLFVSCIQNKPKDQNKAKIESTKSIEEIAVKKDTFTSTLNAENGKWTANPETSEGIEKMKKLIASFTDKDDPKAYNKLKGKLEIVFMNILVDCTMEGESHNQLHDYLIPIRDAFDGLNSNDLTVCKKSFTTVNKRLGEYENYFE